MLRQYCSLHLDCGHYGKDSQRKGVFFLQLFLFSYSEIVYLKFLICFCCSMPTAVGYFSCRESEELAEVEAKLVSYRFITFLTK